MGRWHAHAARRAGATVVGVVDPDLVRATRLARGRGAHTTLDAALRQPVDVVHVCTPLATHVPIVLQALAAGCHVVVEKPAAPSAAEAASITDAARTAGRLLVPVHQFVFQRGIRAIQDCSASFGPIRHLEFATCSAGAGRNEAAEQNSVAAEIVPHAFALARNLLGVTVSALPWRLLQPAPGEWRLDAVTGTGTVVAAMISMNARPTFASLRVLADHGSATADLFHGFAIFERGTASRQYKIARPVLVGVRGASASIGNLVRRTLTGESAYPGLRALFTATYAAVEGKAPVPFHGDEIVDVARARDRVLELAAG